MHTTKLAVLISLISTGIFMSCSDSDSNTVIKDGGTGDGGAGSDDGDLPFTNGVSTLAGMATAGYVDGPRKIAQFSNPVNVAYRNGMLYVADFDKGKLRVIDTATHVTSTVIAMPAFQRPFGLAFAGDGTLYVSTDNDQAGNHTATSGTIWKVDVGAHTATVVANAIGRPRGLTVLPDGRIAAADFLHQVIELVAPDTGRVTLIAGAWDVRGTADGAGAIARFSAPYGIAVRGDGKLIVMDHDNNRIRLVGLDGTTTTLAGTTAGEKDGALGEAKFSSPQGVSVAANGDVFITDLGNFRVRRIAGDHVDTIAGNGTGGYVDSDDRLAAEFYGLEGLAVVPDGSMAYVADGSRGDPLPYNRVRQIKLN